MTTTTTHRWNARGSERLIKDLGELLATAEHLKAHSVESTPRLGEVADRLQADGPGLGLRGHRAVAPITHYGFGQLCSIAAAPTRYMRRIGAHRAAENLRADLAMLDPDRRVNMLTRMFDPAAPSVAAFASETYHRTWEADTLRSLIERHALRERGWQFHAGSIGDRDMFAFFVADDLGGHGGRHRRGLIVEDSPVGRRSLRARSFWFDSMCENGLVFGVSEQIDLARSHSSAANIERWHRDLAGHLDRLETAGVEADLRVMERAERTRLGDTVDEAIERTVALAKRHHLETITEARARKAIELAERFVDRYGDPCTVWAMVGGLTQASQDARTTDARMASDIDAGRLLTLATG